jgi:hypothetical protein
MARMVALLVMVSLHDTQNRMSHCSARQSPRACGIHLTGSRQAIRRRASVFGVISLYLVLCAARTKQLQKTNNPDHGIKRTMQHRGKE